VVLSHCRTITENVVNMFDQYLRRLIDPPLDIIGKRVAAYGITANIITIIGFVLGLIALVLISFKQYNAAIFFICLNRLFDGIDGAVARHSKLTDFGGFLDIVCDFIIYSGVVFAFALGHPNSHLYAAFLIFSFIGPISSFLAYATIAAKKQISSTRRGKKSFYYLGGICEGTETTIVLLLFCIIPEYFNVICLIYGVMCWLTTVGRVYSAWNDFGRSPQLP